MEEDQPKVGKKHRKKKVVGIVFLLLILLAGGLWFRFSPETLQKARSILGITEPGDEVEELPFSVHVLDVGKADAIYLHSGEVDMLIDGGTYDCGEKVCQYLKRRGVTSLDVVVNTHPDQDHIGGLSQVLEEFPVEEIWYGPWETEPETEEYTRFWQVVQEKEIPAYTPLPGQRLFLGGLQIHVLGPLMLSSESNNNSLVIRVAYQDTSILLMGDAEEKEETQIFTIFPFEELSSDILKIGHHGSETSTTPPFLQQVSPRYAIISVGEDANDLPRQSVLDRLKEKEISVYRTDWHGTVVCGSDGTSWIFRTEKEQEELK